MRSLFFVLVSRQLHPIFDIWMDPSLTDNRSMQAHNLPWMPCNTAITHMTMNWPSVMCAPPIHHIKYQISWHEVMWLLYPTYECTFITQFESYHMHMWESCRFSSMALRGVKQDIQLTRANHIRSRDDLLPLRSCLPWILYTVLTYEYTHSITYPWMDGV